MSTKKKFNPLNAELNPICRLLALLGAYHTLHISRIRVNSFFKRCAVQIVQSFMVYTAVYQQQQNGYGAHLAYCRMGTVSHSWGHVVWCVVLSVHQTLAPRLKKVYS